MIASGVGVGDRVAAVISNSVDAIVLCIATLALGAVWSASSPDMGAEAIVGRYIQIRPKIIFADSGYIYASKRIDVCPKIEKWSRELAQCNETLRVVVLPSWKSELSLNKIARSMHWEDFVKLGGDGPLLLKSFPFSQPAFILFSSGTVRRGPLPFSFTRKTLQTDRFADFTRH